MKAYIKRKMIIEGREKGSFIVLEGSGGKYLQHG